MYTIQMPDNKAFADLNFFEKFQKNSWQMALDSV